MCFHEARGGHYRPPLSRALPREIHGAPTRVVEMPGSCRRQAQDLLEDLPEEIEEVLVVEPGAAETLVRRVDPGLLCRGEVDVLVTSADTPSVAEVGAAVDLPGVGASAGRGVPDVQPDAVGIGVVVLGAAGDADEIRCVVRRRIASSGVTPVFSGLRSPATTKSEKAA